MLAACAESDPSPAALPGPFQDVPLDPLAACANDRNAAPDIPVPASAHAPLLTTPEAAARDPDAVGEYASLDPDPDDAPDVLDACAE